LVFRRAYAYVLAGLTIAGGFLAMIARAATTRAPTPPTVPPAPPICSDTTPCLKIEECRSRGGECVEGSVGCEGDASRCCCAFKEVRPPAPPELPPITPPTPPPTPPPPQPPVVVEIPPPPSTYYTGHSMCVKGVVWYDKVGGVKPDSIELYFALHYYEWSPEVAGYVPKVFVTLVDRIPRAFETEWYAEYWKVVSKDSIASALKRLNDFERILRMAPEVSPGIPKYQVQGRGAYFGINGVLSRTGTVFNVVDYYSPEYCRPFPVEGENRPSCCAWQVIANVFSPCILPTAGNIDKAVKERKVEDYALPDWCYRSS
jgi:hypothetical protein